VIQELKLWALKVVERRNLGALLRILKQIDQVLLGLELGNALSARGEHCCAYIQIPNNIERVGRAN